MYAPLGLAADVTGRRPDRPVVVPMQAEQAWMGLVTLRTVVGGNPKPRARKLGRPTYQNDFGRGGGFIRSQRYYRGSLRLSQGASLQPREQASLSSGLSDAPWLNRKRPGSLCSLVSFYTPPTFSNVWPLDCSQSGVKVRDGRMEAVSECVAAPLRDNLNL